MTQQYDFTAVIELLLLAPSEQLDPSMLPLIEKWDRPIPTPLQVLEVLDQCAYAALASDFAMGVLDTIYENAIEAAGTTRAAIEASAVWRAKV